MISDLRFALRQFLKTPGFVVVAVLTLALGIGANTAIFSIVNALLLQPLPYAEPDRLVQVYEIPNGGGFAISDGGVFLDWQSETTQLESIAAAHNVDKNVSGGTEPVRISGAEVSADYLRALRVQPLLGRGFVPQDDAPGGNRHVVILTYELWQSRFQGDPAVIDRTVQMDAESYTVIGVLPPRALPNPNFTFLTPATIRADAYKQVRNYNYVCAVIGRLKPGATAEQAAAELVAARKGINSQYPSFRQNWSVGVRSLQEALYGNSRPYALTLLAAVGAVLLIACANVANLFLAKASSRQGEIAIRGALGASSGRIVRQLITESMLLASAGGLAGILLGALAIHPLIRFANLTSVPTLSVRVDAAVLLFTLGATVLTGACFGLFPALTVARPDFHDCLKEGARGSGGRARRRLQSLLIVAETALTVVLLACSGLLLRSFYRAFSADPGFNRDRAIVFGLTQPASKAPTVQHRTRFIRDMLRSLAQVPGVAYAGEASSTPMNGRVGFGDFVSREELPATRNDYNAGFDGVDGDIFKALGIPLLRGRFFTEADNEENAPRVIIVNEALVRRLYPNEDPIGRLLHFKDAAYQIVGVVGSVRQFQLDVDPFGQVYLPSIRFPWSTMFVVRTHLPPLTLANDLRRAVQAVDPDQPLANLATLADSVEQSLQGRRTILALLLVFAGTALALACIGIYGVMAYSVSQRTREMGIRIALGAGAGQVLGLVLRDGLRLVLIGVGLGAAGGLGAGQLLSSQLYHVTGQDPLTFILVAAVLVAVALLACWLPARRATRVNPVTALRAE